MKTFCNRNFMICSLVVVVAFIKALNDLGVLCGFKTSFFKYTKQVYNKLVHHGKFNLSGTLP